MKLSDSEFQKRYYLFIDFTNKRILNKIWKWTLETQHKHWILEPTHVHLHGIRILLRQTTY